MKRSILAAAFTATLLTTSVAFAAGDYKEISCTSQPFFSANACNQCFDGGKVSVGQKLTGFYDTWTNKNTTEQIAYKDEQSYPEMVSLGGSGTTWKINPADPKLYWKYGADVVWVNSLSGSGKQEFSLEPGKTVTFMEADLGASYSLDKTDKKDGSFVGLMKYPVAFHEVSAAGKEGDKQNHIECVAFATNTVVTPVKTVTPPAPTKVKTGPESILLVGLALILSYAFVAFRRRKV